MHKTADAGFSFNDQNSLYDAPKPKTSLNTRLRALKEKVHLRKIAQIKEESESYVDANKQFCKREENILLNALQFINEVAQKGNESAEIEHIEDDENGIDEGYICRLSKDEIQRPEF